jgi:hypothetical protein
MTSRDRSGHSRKQRARAAPMSKPASLADVARIVAADQGLSQSRRRDIQSALRRTGELLAQELAAIPADLASINDRLSRCLPQAVGVSPKTLANVRSALLAGIKASGLGAVVRSHGIPLSAGWQNLKKQLRSRRHQFGLSRISHYCSGQAIEPQDVNDAVVTQFVQAVYQGTLGRNLRKLHRDVALIWNEVAAYCRIPVQQIQVPAFRHPAERVDWSILQVSFRKDVAAYLDWCSGTDPFAANARSRALAPLTVRLRRNHVDSAITALIASGMKPSSIKSLADLVTIKNFTRILRQRDKIAAGKKSAFNRDLARTLIGVAVTWVEVSKRALKELKRLESAVSGPEPGLSSRNVGALRQFDDPACLRRLFGLPTKLWDEVKRDRTANYNTILKAQAALAVGILCYLPIRSQNLWRLKFNEHIFLHLGRDAVSSLELPAGETKNKRPLAFDIPDHMARMLAEYRDRLVPGVFGRRFDNLFIKQDGSQKNQWSVARLVRMTIKNRAGLQLSVHQFRHLAAQIGLDAEPGNFEGMRQLLGHRSTRTTVESYAGLNSRRAARHHQRLIDRALRGEAPEHDLMG